MSKLPPVEKLPLAVRKNLRDEWDNKKADVEKKISDILTVPWTIEVNPNQIYAYAKSDYAKESLGSCLASYFEGAAYRLRGFVENHGEDGLDELNAIGHAHVLTIDVDEAKQFSYCGIDVHEGKLRILFQEDNLGTNIDDALDPSVLFKALNNAPAPEGAAMNFVARMDVRREYEPNAENVRKQIADILARPDIKLSPNFEDTYAKLLEASKDSKSDLREDWASTIGAFTRMYFEGLVTQLKSQKFHEDEMLQEGFNEEVSKGEIAFRVVDSLQKGTYSEAVFENGVLYLQCIPKYWGTNIDYTAENLVDKL